MSQDDPQKIPADPIYAKSYSWPIAIASLALLASMVLAMADEFWFRRPYKAYQKEFVAKYADYLDRLATERQSVEDTIKGLDEFKTLQKAVNEAEQDARDEQLDIDRQTKNLSRKIRALSDTLKPHNSKIAALTYSMEDAVHKAVHHDHAGAELLVKDHAAAQPFVQEIQQVLGGEVEYSWMAKEEGAEALTEQSAKGKIGELRQAVLDLRDEKSKLQGRMAGLTKPAGAARTELGSWLKSNLGNLSVWLENGDDSDEARAARVLVAQKVAEVGVRRFLANHTTGLTATQISSLKESAEKDAPFLGVALFGGTIKENYMARVQQWVDRCETCHMGIQSPVPITADDVPGAAGHERLFVSHPTRELLDIHPPEDFGCSLCHGGNGVAITSGMGMQPEYLPHGNDKYWLHKLHPRENFEAGCVRCHEGDVQLEHGDRINAGRQTFLKLGCWGCHERDGYDSEGADARLAQKRLGEIDAEIDARLLRQKNLSGAVSSIYDFGADQEERADELQKTVKADQAALTQQISGLGNERVELLRRFVSLQGQRKKAGPNLKEVRKKLNKGWLTQWIENPGHWRPTTKMPRYRWEESFEVPEEREEAIRQIAAFIWQQADDPSVNPVAKGPAGDAKAGRDIFRTVGCMSCHAIGEGEDQEGGDFAANLSNLGDKANADYIASWIRDPRSHSPKTVMPSFRLTDKESRDVAAYLLSESGRDGYAPDDGAWLDDAAMAKTGEDWVKHFGCAGCHEINGLENEGRIGVPLTKEGSKPHEQLDFGHFTAQAKRGTFDPLTDWETADGVKLFAGDAGKKWYGHRGFFMRKLASPGVYDLGKRKSNAKERLRMPKFDLTAQQLHDLTSFLLGSMDQEQTPENVKYQPDAQGRAIQDGWKVVKRYNCQGCHQIRPGAVPSLQTLAHFRPEEPNFKDLPPSLVGTGFRSNPDWLGQFLHDPALGGGEQNPKSGRPHLSVRMPSFEMSDNEVDILVKFFDALSEQPEVYRKPPFVPLSAQELRVAQTIFDENKCASCHVVEGKPITSETKAPNLTLAETRLRPSWIKQWIATPAALVPGTAMPQFFTLKDDGTTWRSISNTALVVNHPGDHIDLMVRYLRSLSRSK